VGKYLNKILEIKNKCSELFDHWVKCVSDCKLVAPKVCSPELFNMFKQLVKEYDIQQIKDAISYFYYNYPQIQRLFNLKTPIPEFKSFYIRRHEIIQHTTLLKGHSDFNG
jgi:hypothetical protein